MCSSDLIAFEAMEILGLNGVEVWTSITGGQRTVQVPADHLNLQWVLGNKLLLGSVNANRKHFEAGILCMDPIYLGVKKNDTVGESYWMNSDGKRGSGSRVLRTFPCVQEWKVKVPFYVLDQTITEPVFRKYVNEAGKFIGIGRFRPRNGGFYGRFKLANLEWHPE